MQPRLKATASGCILPPCPLPPTASQDPPPSFPVAANLSLTIGSLSPRVWQDHLDVSASVGCLRNKSLPPTPPSPRHHVADGPHVAGWHLAAAGSSCLHLGLAQSQLPQSHTLPVAGPERGLQGPGWSGGLLLCSSPPHSSPSLMHPAHPTHPDLVVTISPPPQRGLVAPLGSLPSALCSGLPVTPEPQPRPLPSPTPLPPDPS